MPPRLGLRPVLRTGRSGWPIRIRNRTLPVCIFCSLSTRPVPSSRRVSSRQKLADTRRAESTDSSTATPKTSPGARKDLESALLDLQKHAANYVNLSRVQLALRNLRQEPGDESIRVAILAMANGTEPGRTAKKLSKLLLADGLVDEEAWERQLETHDITQPLIIRVGKESPSEGEAVKLAKDDLLPEINVSSPRLNRSKIELLVMEVNPFAGAVGGGEVSALEETVLVPTVDIPTSSTGRYSPITTPVHKALLVSDGIKGAASILSLPFLETRDTIAAAINLRKYTSEDTTGLPFIKIDVDAADNGLGMLREDIQNALKASDLQVESNVGAIEQWLKYGTVANEQGATKDAVRNLVKSLLGNSMAVITEAEARRLASTLTGKASPAALANLSQTVSEWAQSAHEELQQQLDIAFTGRRWRKLGWWKLFWRVDDVGMLSSEMVSQRFVPQAERGLIYLAGRIREAGVGNQSDGPAYSGPVLPSPTSDNGKPVPAATQDLGGKWPTHIPFTRHYLLDTTVPALQALAQKLMAQSLSTSTVTTILGGLTYFSGFGFYEAGAVAGLGLVWSLRRLQKKWETARDYWQGEVREEGRKAVRASEASLLEVLDQATTKRPADEVGELRDLRRARELVQRAEEALERLK